MRLSFNSQLSVSIVPDNQSQSQSATQHNGHHVNVVSFQINIDWTHDSIENKLAVHVSLTSIITFFAHKKLTINQLIKVLNQMYVIHAKTNNTQYDWFDLILLLPTCFYTFAQTSCYHFARSLHVFQFSLETNWA